MKTTRYFWSFLAQSILELEMFQKKKKVVEEIRTQIVRLKTFFFSPKVVPFMR